MSRHSLCGGRVDPQSSATGALHDGLVSHGDCDLTDQALGLPQECDVSGCEVKRHLAGPACHRRHRGGHGDSFRKAQQSDRGMTLKCLVMPDIPDICFLFPPADTFGAGTQFDIRLCDPQLDNL